MIRRPKRASNKIIEANQAYREGKPIITDDEYDEMIESEGIPDEQTPIDPLPSDINNTIELSSYTTMGRLRKAKTYEDVLAWYKNVVGDNTNVTIGLSEKHDGVSLEIVYDENGEVDMATTRGDGERGQNLTSELMTVHNLTPLMSKFKMDMFVVRYELTMTTESLSLIHI